MLTSVKVPAVNGAPDPRVFLSIALSGETMHPGKPACVWIHEDSGSSKYCLLKDIERVELRDGLLNVRDEHNFLIVKQTNDDQAHIFKVPKSQAMSHMTDALTAASRDDP